MSQSIDKPTQSRPEVRQVAYADLLVEHDELATIADTHSLDCLCEQCQRFLDVAQELGRRQSL